MVEIVFVNDTFYKIKLKNIEIRTPYKDGSGEIEIDLGDTTLKIEVDNNAITQILNQIFDKLSEMDITWLVVIDNYMSDD